MTATEDIDPSASRTVEDFAGYLRSARVRADGISFRQLEQWGRQHGQPLPRSTIVDVLAGRRLPRKKVLLAYLSACGISQDRIGPWLATWDRLTQAYSSVASPAPGTYGMPHSQDAGVVDVVTAGSGGRPAELRRVDDIDEVAVKQLRAEAQREIDVMYAEAARDIRKRRLAAQIGADVRAAGLRRLGSNYLNDLDWTDLFAHVRELDIVVAYGHTWRNLHARELYYLAGREGARIRVFLPDTAVAATMAVLSQRFAITPDELKTRIEATRDAYTRMRQPGGATVEIYYHEGDRMFSVYRLDDVAVVGFYSHSQSRLSSVPVFVCESPGTLYRFVTEELVAIEQQSQLLY